MPVEGRLAHDLDAVSGEAHRRGVRAALATLVGELPEPERAGAARGRRRQRRRGLGARALEPLPRARARPHCGSPSACARRIAGGLALPFALLRTLGLARDGALLRTLGPIAAVAVAGVASVALVLPATEAARAPVAPAGHGCRTSPRPSSTSPRHDRATRPGASRRSARRAGEPPARPHAPSRHACRRPAARTPRPLVVRTRRLRAVTPPDRPDHARSPTPASPPVAPRTSATDTPHPRKDAHAPHAQNVPRRTPRPRRRSRSCPTASATCGLIDGYVVNGKTWYGPNDAPPTLLWDIADDQCTPHDVLNEVTGGYYAHRFQGPYAWIATPTWNQYADGWNSIRLALYCPAGRADPVRHRQLRRHGAERELEPARRQPVGARHRHARGGRRRHLLGHRPLHVLARALDGQLDERLGLVRHDGGRRRHAHPRGQLGRPRRQRLEPRRRGPCGSTTRRPPCRSSSPIASALVAGAEPRRERRAMPARASRRCASSCVPAGGAWQTLGSDGDAPYTLVAPAAVADGAYDVRAVATDALGNQSASAATPIVIDRTAPDSAIDAIPATVSGTIALGATASDALTRRRARHASSTPSPGRAPGRRSLPSTRRRGRRASRPPSSPTGRTRCASWRATARATSSPRPPAR